MRVLVLAGIMSAGAALVGCQAGPPPSANTRQPAVAQDAGQAAAMPPAIAELPPVGTEATANIDANGLDTNRRDANGPPIDLLQPAAP